MKKHFIRVLIIVLLILTETSMARTENSPNLNLLSAQLSSGQLRATSAVVWKERLYIKTNRGVFSWQQGQTEAELVTELDHGWLGQKENPDYFDTLLTDDNAIYALNRNTGVLWPIVLEENSLVFGDKIQLDWRHFIQEGGTETYVFPPEDVILSDGKLYMLAPNEYGGNFHLASIDISKGDFALYDDYTVSDIRSFALYHNAELLLTSSEEHKNQQGQTETVSLLNSFNPQTHEYKQLGTLDYIPHLGSVSIAYNHANDSIYYAGQNALYRFVSSGEDIACATLSANDMMKLTILNDGRICGISSSGVLIRSDNPNGLNNMTTLRIAGRIDNQLMQLVQAQLPDIKIEQVDDLNTNEQLVESMLTGSPAVDIYVLDSDQHAIESMSRKGYLLPLPKDSRANSLTSSSLEMIQSVLTHNGLAYGLPIGFDFNVAQHDRSLLNETGLSSPIDFTSYCGTLADWSNGTFDDFPEYRLTANPKEKNEAYRLALRLYRDHLRQTGDDLKFDTELFRSIMEMISPLDLDVLDDLPNPEDMFDDILGIREMISNSVSYSPSMEHDGASLSAPFDMVMYSLQPDSSPLGRGNLKAVAVSSRSALQDEAMLFLEACAQHLPTTTIALVSANWTEAVENPQYESEVDRYRYLISDVQGMIDSALRQGATSVPSYEADLAQFQAILAEAESTLRYQLTEEEVNMMRERLSHVYIPSEIQRLEDRSGIDDLFTQFIEGALPLEQFIQSADSRLRLIRLENE